jgi:hypothetical protein
MMMASSPSMSAMSGSAPTYSMAPAMSTLGITMQGSNMAGLSWVWCGAAWVTLPAAPLSGVPC